VDQAASQFVCVQRTAIYPNFAFCSAGLKGDHTGVLEVGERCEILEERRDVSGRVIVSVRAKNNAVLWGWVCKASPNSESSVLLSECNIWCTLSDRLGYGILMVAHR